MKEHSQKSQNSRLRFFLITVGFIALGGIIGVLIGALLYTYLIPVWNHTEIDIEGLAFTEIVLVDYFFLDNTDLYQDNVVLKTTDGEYYSYHQNKWQLTDPPKFDETAYPHNYPPCDEWLSPPPVTYLRKMKDSVGYEFAHAIAITSRCYVLLADGSFHSWTRDYGAYEMFGMGAASLIFGMIIGVVFKGFLVERKSRKDVRL